ncbi:MAG: ABC transporter substrate-binding protein, partial [Nocardioidaceae bacterium]
THPAADPLTVHRTLDRSPLCYVMVSKGCRAYGEGRKVVRVVANLRSMVAGVAVAALVVAACSGGDDSSPTPEPPLGGDGAVVMGLDPDRVGPAAPIEGAVAGGTVTALGADGLEPADFSSGVDGIDPTDAFWPIPLSILTGLVTRSLTQYVYDSGQGSMVLVPDLATDLGTPNEDFTEWSFTIRDGVKFENGKTVTAEDVLYGIKRSFDRDTFVDGPTYSNDYFLNGDTYKGVYTGGTDYAGVVVEGDTLTITMARPFPEMPYWGAFPAMGPIPERGSEPDRYARHPLATGPYKFADYIPGESLTLVRNEQWDPDTDPGRHAYPDRYEFDFTVPRQQIDAAILGDSEQGQTAVSLSRVLTQGYTEAEELDRLTPGPGPCTNMLAPDYRKITDIEVRQAIGYAYPYEQLPSVVTEGIEAVTTLQGTPVLPPGFPGRQDYTVLETEPGETDPDKARALLREAGFAPGEYELKFGYAQDEPFSVKRNDILVAALEAAGFEVSPFPTASEDLYTLNEDPDAPINLRSGGWCPDLPTGASWFPPLFGSDGGGRAHFAEPAVDAEIERISRLPFEDQPAAWGALDKTIMTDYYPAIVTGYQAEPILHGSRIGGINVDNIPSEAMPTWKDLHVIQ